MDPITRLNAALEGRYRIERELGEGGMATIYLAEDLKHRREVAVKVLEAEVESDAAAERFEREIETIARMRNVTDAVLQAVGTNREWTKNYGVIHALIHNPRTLQMISTNFISPGTSSQKPLPSVLPTIASWVRGCSATTFGMALSRPMRFLCGFMPPT